MSDKQKIELFLKKINEFRKNGRWSRNDIIELFNEMLPHFHHLETGRFLDSKM